RDAEGEVMLHERLHIQRAVAHDGDDEQFVEPVVHVSGTVDVRNAAAQQERTHAELQRASCGRTQRAHVAFPKVAKPHQPSSSTSNAQVTSPPVPDMDVASVRTTSISNADST